MKKILLLSGLSLILLATPGCKKDKTTLTNRRVPPPPPPPPTNTAPYVGIGDNLEKFPFSKIELFSWAYDEQEDSLSYSWAKVSGPESYRIENTDMPSTLISNLVNGKYKFEIAAKDASGLVGRDTISIHVELKPLTSNEIIFKDLVWAYDEWGGHHLTIPSFIYFAEAGRPYKVFVKENNAEWIEASNPYTEESAYTYYPATNLFTSLLIYIIGSDPLPSSVKVVFQ